MGDDDPVTVGIYLTRGDAEVARALLSSAGIRATIHADDEGGLNPGFFAWYGVRVVVDPAHAAEARCMLGAEECVVIPDKVRRVIFDHCRRCYPEEACGLLAGDGRGGVVAAYPTANVDHSRDRFTVDPVEHFEAWRHAEAAGRELVGVYHSHPASVAVPSEHDVSGALDPAWLYLIVGPMDGEPELRAFWITGGVVREVLLDAGGG